MNLMTWLYYVLIYFKNSFVAKIINAEKTGYKTLKEAWMAWNKSQNKVMQGLINRRNAE